MNIEDLRNYCLSLDGVTERMPFEVFFRNRETLLAFYGPKNHIFCLIDIDKNDVCTVRNTPEKITELKEKFMAITNPYNFNPNVWIGIKFNLDMSDSLIKELVMESYTITNK